MPDPEVVGDPHPPIPAPAVKRIHDVTDRIKWDLTPEQKDPEFIEQVKDLVSKIINEGTTDWLIEIIKAMVPWPGLGWLVGKVLDTLLPERLVGVIHTLLNRLAD